MNAHFIKIPTVMLLVISCFFATGQTAQTEKSLETLIESWGENHGQESNTSMIIEKLEELLEQPVNVNCCTSKQLEDLYMLNEIQIEKLLTYINTFGPAYSIYELSTIDGFSKDLLQMIEPFITFGPSIESTLKTENAIKRGKHQLLLRGTTVNPKSKGYSPDKNGDTPYSGNSHRYYMRYSFKAFDNISAGITAEKDPGESFFSKPNKQGFDFYSAHLKFKLSKTIESIVLGDFIVRSGQGLVLWQSYSMGKSENVMNIAKNNQGIKPYTSVDENQFFRGVSALLNLDKTNLYLYYSNNKIDGNLILLDGEPNHFTSRQTSGYHRTLNEIEDKNAIRNENAGALLIRRFEHLKVGATISHESFPLPLIPKESPYNQFRFSGKSNYTAGIDYLYNKNKYQFFGESALSKSGGKAILQGTVVQLNDQLGFSALFRHFDTNYHAYWSNAFSEGSSAINETGMYVGIKLLPLKFISLTAYTDLYKSDWEGYSTVAPARGLESFVQINFVKSRNFELYLRYKMEEKDRKIIDNKIYINEKQKLSKSRLELKYGLNDVFRFKTRFEYSQYNWTNKDLGFLLFQDFYFRPEKLPLQLSTRIARFKTDSYQSRIYAYENDLLYTFSIPAYYGNGYRTYVNLKFKINRSLDFWFKIANTTLIDQNTISSGYNEIPGNNKTELKFQLRLKI